MGVLDRIQQRGLPSSQTSSTLALAEEAPEVLVRFKATVEYFMTVMVTGDSTKKRTAKLLKMIIDEAFEELKDAPAEALEQYFTQAAGTMYWAATGERIMNIELPEGFAASIGMKDLPAMEYVEPGELPEPVTQAEIEAAVVD